MRVFHVPPDGLDPDALREPAEILRRGGVVAFPTETVYGLGVSSRLPDAVQRLAEIKQRPRGKAFSYHLAGMDQVAKLESSLTLQIPGSARILMERYWPGPLTLVLPASSATGLTTVGVRVPANEVARRLIETVGAPLFVPSANPSGEPPAISAEEVEKYFGDSIDAIVDGGTVQLKQASTVVRVDGKGYEVLREGIITREMIHQLLEGKRVLFVCTGNTCRSPMAAEIFRKCLAERLGRAVDELNELGYRILSAGTFAMRGGRPSDHAVSVLQELGYNLSGHVSQPVTPELLASVDHVYALGQSHFDLIEAMIEEIEPSQRPRLDMLQEDSITDPVGGDVDTYRRCAREIEAAILEILPR